MPLSAIQELLNKLVLQHGSDIIRDYLCNFDKFFSETSYRLFCVAMSVTAMVYNIEETEILNRFTKKPETTDARRIVSKIMCDKTKLKKEAIGCLLRMKNHRVIFKYKREVKHMLSNPKPFPEFNRKYYEIISLLKSRQVI